MVYEKVYCIICEKEIIKRKGESIKRYSQKKVCSNECKGKYMEKIKIKDLTGEKYGKLKVIKNSGRKTNANNVIWECQCDCGNITYVPSGDLQKEYGGTKSCGECSENQFEKQDEGYWLGEDCKGKIFIFNDIDYEFIKQHTWNIDNNGYAMTMIDGKKVALHRLIMGVQNENITVDHINKKRYDNRRNNLRICELQKNLWNKDKRSDKEYTSKYIGVHWHITKEKWIANIRLDDSGKQKHLGSFDNEIEAAKAYDKKCYEMRKDYAVLNFPEDYGLI